MLCIIFLDQELISYTTHLVHVVVVLLVVKDIPANSRSDLRCQVGSGISRNFLHENMHQLTESDFLFEITFSRWWPWHFLQKSGAIWWVHRNRLPGKYAAASGSSWAKVDSYLLELFVLYHVISSHHIM